MVLRSELEKDLNKIINDLQTTDYSIPSIMDITFPALKKLKVFFIFVFVSGLFTWFYHGPHELLIGVVIICYSLLGVGVITLFVVGVLYYPNILQLCLSNDVRNSSFLCLKLEDYIKRSEKYINTISIVLSVPFVLFVGSGGGFLIPFVIYFAMIFLGSIVVSVAMSRYLTPEFINVIGNVRKNIK